MLSIVTFWILACNAGQKIADKNNACNTFGLVQDYSKLDGCKLLIETEKGTLLRPAELPEGAYLRDGQKIRFGYEEMPEMMSICMRERMTVRITCLEVVQ